MHVEMTLHEESVARIAATVKEFHRQKQSFRIFHGSSNSTRPPHDERVVDISALSNVLEINAASRTAVVEPNVPMDKLVRETLSQGMIPPVVMEFPGITVGGGFAGSAGESSSFKYGYFDETVKSIEMVLTTGEIIQASDTQNPTIFKGAAGSLGTLGITTKLEINLVPAKRFVKLVYRPFSNSKETIHALKNETEDMKNDYVDGIMFSESHGVVMIGHLVDEIPSSEAIKTFSGPWDPWFYLHVKEKSRKESSVDYIPIAEYLFRYDRGGFWVGKQAFDYFSLMPFNRLTRWFLNDFVHTRMLYRALHGSNMSFGTMIQDLSLPYDTAEEFVHYTSRELGIWPLWLCPLRAVDPPTFHPSHVDTQISKKPQPMLNIGLWGEASKDVGTFIRQNRELEQRLTELGGRKVLYSHTYYTEDEFWQLYNKRWYDALRLETAATTLPTVYDKVKIDVARVLQVQKLPWFHRLALSWPFAGFVGIWYAIRSKDYYIHRNLRWMKWKLGKR